MVKKALGLIPIATLGLIGTILVSNYIWKVWLEPVAEDHKQEIERRKEWYFSNR